MYPYVDKIADLSDGYINYLFQACGVARLMNIANPPSTRDDLNVARPRARRMDKTQRIQQILSCALLETASRGLGHAKHTDIAHRAGVAVPTVFHYFKTRDDLSKAVIVEVERFLFEEIVAPCFAATNSAPEALLGILLSFADAIDTHPQYIRVWLGWSTAVDTAYWPDYLSFYERAIALVSERIEAGKREGTLDAERDTGDEARVIVGLAHMIAQMKFANQARESIERAIRFVIDGYLTRCISFDSVR